MNANDNVWVRLTLYGEHIWSAEWERAGFREGVPAAVREANTEPDGSVRFQLWDLMHTFGPVCFMGNPHMPFKDNEIITKYDRSQQH